MIGGKLFSFGLQKKQEHFMRLTNLHFWTRLSDLPNLGTCKRQPLLPLPHIFSPNTEETKRVYLVRFLPATPYFCTILFAVCLA